ncbi:MAG: DUF3667 domain-containing protein [Pseudomonadota bacterium]
MGDFDALGTAVTGGMLARAVEPGAGEAGDDGRTHERKCLNCGAPLTGPYCAQCGQKSHVHRSLRAFMGDFIAGILNFEGKFWRTLPMLAWRPGQLTRRYIDGERARFISPIALFLFSVFLLFATIQLIGGPSDLGKLTSNGQAYHSTDEAIAGEKAKLARLESKRRAAVDADDIKELDGDIAEQKKTLATLERFKREGVVNAVLAEQESDFNARSSLPMVNDAIKRAKANPQLAIYRLQDAASKYAWALIPISAPFLWLLFPFSWRFRIYDHTVFVTYSLAFMMLLGIAMSLWGAAGLPGVGFAALYPPVHMYRDLKQSYGLGRFGALWRTAALLLFSVIALALFAMTVIVLGMAG